MFFSFQAKLDKELDLSVATKNAGMAQRDLEKVRPDLSARLYRPVGPRASVVLLPFGLQVQSDLSLARVELAKHEKLGHKKSIENLRKLVGEVSALSLRLNETAIEHIDPMSHEAPRDTAGLRALIDISNREIDRVCKQVRDTRRRRAQCSSGPRSYRTVQFHSMARCAAPCRRYSTSRPTTTSTCRCASSSRRCCSTTRRCASSSTRTPRGS